MNKKELRDRTVSELRALAKAKGLRGYSALRKAELVDLLAGTAPSKRRTVTSPGAGAKPRPRRTAGQKKRAALSTRSEAKPSKGGAPARSSGRRPPGRRRAGSRPGAPRAAQALGEAGDRGLSPRTRRAFSIYRALGEQRVKASKYYLGVKDSPELDEGFEFPESHGDNVIVLMVRDPYWLFSYWELSPDLHGELLDQLGEETLHRSRLVLRVYDVTGTTPEKPVSVHDIDIAAGARDWYINVTRVEREYCVDIGLLLPDGSFIVIARSNRVSLPPIGPSDVVDEEWVTLDELGEIYALIERGPSSGSGGWGSGGWDRC